MHYSGATELQNDLRQILHVIENDKIESNAGLVNKMALKLCKSRGGHRCP